MLTDCPKQMLKFCKSQHQRGEISKTGNGLPTDSRFNAQNVKRISGKGQKSFHFFELLNDFSKG